MNNNYSVYKHTFPNGKIYIGITSLKPEKRWHTDGGGYDSQQYMSRAIQKYGWDNIVHEILFDKLTKEEAEQKEIELIALYKSNEREYGYNVQNGGNTTGTHSEETKEHLRKIAQKRFSVKENHPFYKRHHTEETKKKLSEVHKGKKLDEETRKKLSKLKSGENNPMYGKRGENNPSYKRYRTDETRKKISEANKGKKKTEEHKKHLSESLKGKFSGENNPMYGKHHMSGENNPMYGKHHSEESKSKISKSLKGKLAGENHPFYGKHHSEESKSKMMTKVVCIETGTVYESVQEASQKTGANHITDTCKGKRNVSGGYHWKYLYDQTNKDGTIVQGAISLGLITEEDALNMLKQGANA